jgi:hypothetical protein
MLKTGHVAVGFVIVILAGVAVFAPGIGRAEEKGQEQPPATTDPARPPAAPRGVSLIAPHADIKVDKEQGKVSVRAPASSVDVDVDGGQVRVRAPYVNLDVRW